MATRPSAQQRAARTRRFQHVLRTIGDNTGARLLPAWDALSSYGEDQIPQFTRSTAPILDAAKTASVRHAVAFYALTAGVAPVAIRLEDIAVQPDMRAPFIATWLALKGGASLDESVTAGTSRLDAVARDFVTSSSRQTGDLVVEHAGLRIVGWERVPDDSACDWCLEVSPGFYHSADSADFGHNNCGCTAEPIYV